MTRPTATDLVKLYYRIGEVSQIVGVQPHVLRYWESEFRTIRPQKSGKGQRIYSRRDVEKLLRVKDLLKNQGFTIAGARKKLRDPAEPRSSSDSAVNHAPPAAAVSPALHGAPEKVADAAEGSPPQVPVFRSDAAQELNGSPDWTESAPRGEGPPTNTAKSLRRALLALRRDLLELHRDLLTGQRK